ncbi:hypothetical protein [Nocardia heshunensis]
MTPVVGGVTNAHDWLSTVAASFGGISIQPAPVLGGLADAVAKLEQYFNARTAATVMSVDALKKGLVTAAQMMDDTDQQERSAVAGVPLLSSGNGAAAPSGVKGET